MRRAKGPSHRPRNRNKDEGRPTNPGGYCLHLLGQTPDIERANVQGQHKQNQQQNDEYHLKEKQNQSPSLWSPQRESPAKIPDKQRPDTHPQVAALAEPSDKGWFRKGGRSGEEDWAPALEIAQ